MINRTAFIMSSLQEKVTERHCNKIKKYGIEEKDRVRERELYIYTDREREKKRERERERCREREM